MKEQESILGEVVADGDPSATSHSGGEQGFAHLIGKTVGHYKILSMLGAGAMGAVFEVEQPLLKQRFAMKMLIPDAYAGSAAIKRFKAEAQAISGLEHPNLPRIYEFGISDEGEPYLVTDLVAGQPLSKLIAGVPKLTAEQILDITRQACQGLEHAHERGVIHRDIKPSNIMIPAPGEHAGGKAESGPDPIKVIDFGIAKQLDEQPGTLGTLTGTGMLMGTPTYMSPEQCQGFKLDARTDVYSLGCVLYEMLSNQAPFGGDNMVQVIFAHLNQQPKPMKTSDKLAEQLQRVAFKCLEKRPEDRYQTMSDLLADLKVIEGGASPVIRKGRRKKLSAKERIRLYAIISLSACVIAVGAALWPVIAPALVLNLNLPPWLGNAIYDLDQAKALQIRQQTDGLFSSARLATGDLDKDKLTLAEALLRSVSTGPKTDEICRENLLIAIAAQGRIDDCIATCRALGGSDSDLADRLHWTAFNMDNKYHFVQQALPLYERSHEIYAKLFGDVDQRALKDEYNASSCLVRTGHEKEGDQRLASLLPKLEKVYGKQHPITVSCQRLLAAGTAWKTIIR